MGLALEQARGGALRGEHACARRRRRRPLLGAPRGSDGRAGGAGSGRRRPSSTGCSAGYKSPVCPVVGVETTTADSSAIELYRTQGVSSVDDVETFAGHVALALLLAGGATGPLRGQGLGERRRRPSDRVGSGPEWLSSPSSLRPAMRRSGSARRSGPCGPSSATQRSSSSTEPPRTAPPRRRRRRARSSSASRSEVKARR